jgi:hypothetical protein
MTIISVIRTGPGISSAEFFLIFTFPGVIVFGRLMRRCCA